MTRVATARRRGAGARTVRFVLTVEELEEMIRQRPDSALANLCREMLRADPVMFRISTMLAPVLTAVLLIWVWVLVPTEVRVAVRAAWITTCVRYTVLKFAKLAARSRS